MSEDSPLVVPFDRIGRNDVARVGGKNASLGEMIQRLKRRGIRVPDGFATTADAYRAFLAANGLEEKIAAKLAAFRRGRLSLAKAGAAVRAMILKADFPPKLAQEIREFYRALGPAPGGGLLDVAVRSSATAEDLPEASFAGQQESFLNIRGEEALVAACQRCYASLFTDRAITYRKTHGFDDLKVALSVGVQRMVRSDGASSGVIFSLDTETGFPDAVLITSAWGLGESVVQGIVDPDEFMVFKPLMGGRRRPIIERKVGAKSKKIIYAASGKSPTRTVATSAKERASLSLTEEEVLTLARWAVEIEKHYGVPMDIEWAKDARTGELAVVQARPETVQSRREAATLKSYRLKRAGKRLCSGLSIGDAIAVGKVCPLKSPSEIERFETGGVLVTGMTDPDWVPIMKRAAAIVTDHGGRTSHAAIVSRELGLPAIVGTGDATRRLKAGREVTVSCAEGDEGRVYEGRADYEVKNLDLEKVPRTRTEVMLNLANPAAAFRWWRLPCDGVGLARMEFIINNAIKIHPMALVRYNRLEDKAAKREIARLTERFEDKTEFFVDTLSLGIARIAAAQYPRPVIVRLSDFKTNEYADLIGGRQFEPKEGNPMIGWRGASRYYSEDYREGFALECRALLRVREEIGLDNVIVMVPFCRTLAEADRVLATMAEFGLLRGRKGLKVYVMCEIPANVILAEGFAERFDGFSIGSNDLTQLILGIDRDSDRLSSLFDEDNEAVRRAIQQVIGTAHRAGRKVGLCGQAPSDRPHFARFLVAAGIDSISVSPDSFIPVKEQVAAAESERPERRDLAATRTAARRPAPPRHRARETRQRR